MTETPSAQESAFRRYLIAVLVLALIALIVHDIFGEHGYLVLHKSKRDYEQLQKEFQALTEENKRLAAQVKALKTDPKAIEKIAREEMKLARPGELVYTLPQNNRKKSASPDQAPEPPRKNP